MGKSWFPALHVWVLEVIPNMDMISCYLWRLDYFTKAFSKELWIFTEEKYGMILGMELWIWLPWHVPQTSLNSKKDFDISIMSIARTKESLDPRQLVTYNSLLLKVYLANEELFQNWTDFNLSTKSKLYFNWSLMFFEMRYMSHLLVACYQW